MPGVPRAIGLGFNVARPGGRRGVGEKGSDRIRKTAEPSTVDNATTRVALRLRWQTGAFDGGDDSVECTRESDGTWTGDEQSRWQTDIKSASRGTGRKHGRNWEMRARAPVSRRDRCGSVQIRTPACSLGRVGGGVSHQQTHGRQWELRPPITSYPPTCGQARLWGMKYGATGSAARDKRRAARVRGQKAGRQGQHLPPHSRRPLVFSTSAGDLKFKFRSRCALIWHEKVQKVTKMRSSPIRASLFSN